jgi:hypothetical protein
MSFCRWLNVIVEGVQSCSAMAQERGRGNTFKILVFPDIFLFSLSLSPFFCPLFSFLFRHGEGDKEKMADEAHGCRGAQGRLPALNPTMVVVKKLGPLRRSKGLVNYVYPPRQLLAHHTSDSNKGYRSRIPNGHPRRLGVLLIA